MTFRQVLHRWYARRLKRRLAESELPRHIGLVIDGNRRWARQMGYENPSVGHRHGAEHIERALVWCTEIGISHVTVFVVSADNLRKRSSAEVTFLLELIEEVIGDRLARSPHPWQIHVAGRLDDLPDSTRHALKLAEEATRQRPSAGHLTVAIGYDGRGEIVDAVSALLDDEAGAGATAGDLAPRITPEAIAAHLYTSGRPEPDLIIRTSGEQRMSGFLLWQAAHSELHFCDVYWPGFRRVDFLRALRTYADRRSLDGHRDGLESGTDATAQRRPL